ncbi:MAG: diguanylate cyclase [Burkholderiales bacterium]|nr:diguanylate cyclase [Burkholderiales bacterium]
MIEPTYPADDSQHASASPEGDQRDSELRFVRRVHRMRTLGLGLGFLCVSSVLWLHGASPWWWALVVVNAFAWPHLALLLAARSKHPHTAELRNLMVDSAMGGVWVAVMHFNLLPSVLVVTMLAVDKVSVGGVPLLARTFMLLAVTCALVSAALGFPLELYTPMSVIVACLPLLAIYPVAVSAATYALARKVGQQNRSLAEMGRTDSLTGLANRRKCLEVVQAEYARHSRAGRPATLLMLDVDRFKDINDRFGHPAGDEVLCGVAACLRRCCRSTDTAGRYGGDEFLLVLPETDLAGAQGVAARIRAELETLAFRRAPDLRSTVSIGAAQAQIGAGGVDAWVARADAAMYRAKGEGRDRFAAAESAASPPSARTAGGDG